MVNKKDYIIKQLGRTKGKHLELYAITRIIHTLDDLDLKFITQQYVSRPGNKRALTDLYFPQLGLHIEIDEPHHLNQQEQDKLRSEDIVNATKHKIERVNMHKDFSILEVNKQIDSIVNLIRKMKNSCSDFKPWDFESEYLPNTYIEKGYIDIKDDVSFRTIKDACNCFGHNYKGFQGAGTTHPEKDTMLWFPKLFPNGEWNNQISNDEDTIVERHEDDDKAKEHVKSHINQERNEKHKRIVFAKVKGALGDVLYRFRGLYELCLSDSSERKGLVWKRISIRVRTYPQRIRKNK